MESRRWKNKQPLHRQFKLMSAFARDTICRLRKAWFRRSNKDHLATTLSCERDNIQQISHLQYALLEGSKWVDRYNRFLNS